MGSWQRLGGQLDQDRSLTLLVPKPADSGHSCPPLGRQGAQEVPEAAPNASTVNLDFSKMCFWLV